MPYFDQTVTAFPEVRVIVIASAKDFWRLHISVRWLLLLLALATLGATTGARAQAPPQGATQQSPPIPELPRGVTNPAEFAAYLAALNTPDATKRAQALEVFIAWYPNSVLRIGAYEQAMAAWQTANDPGKADALAVKLLQIDPDNVRALANRAYVGRTRAMAGTPDALASAVAAAQQGVAALPKWQRPSALSEPDFTRLKMQILAIFDGTLGFAALQAKDYAKARGHLLEAVAVDPDNMPDVYQLSVAMLEGQPLDVQGFWYVARAIAMARAAKNDAAAASIEKYARSRYQHYHGSDEGWADLLARVASGGARPPDGFAASVSRAMTPSETAVQMATAPDPGNLSFVEWEFVLSHRDDSNDNREAADKVWKAIGEKQKGGARLKIPMKVISVTHDRMQGAMSKENQANNIADLDIELDHPLSPLPAIGAAISIVGTLSNYRPRPFLFYLTKAELADESLPVAGGDCADPRPQMCTREYRPACGIHRDGSRKTYSNPCSACADADVVSQAAGACP